MDNSWQELCKKRTLLWFATVRQILNIPIISALLLFASMLGTQSSLNILVPAEEVHQLAAKIKDFSINELGELYSLIAGRGSLTPAQVLASVPCIMTFQLYPTVDGLSPYTNNAIAFHF